MIEAEMNVTETSVEGLRRQLRVVIGADELEQRLSARLDELKGKARLKGFRPGHVPKEHLRKVYGRSVMAEVVQQAVAETSREALSQREERPAFQPTVGLPEDEAEIDKIFAGTSDLAYTLSFEVLPKFELMDFGKLALEKPVAAVNGADIDSSLDRIRAANLRYTPKDGVSERRRPSDHRFHRLDRRQTLRRRFDAGRAGCPRQRQFHSRLRGRFDRRPRRQRPRDRGDLPQDLPGSKPC
jgi:trigger factor